MSSLADLQALFRSIFENVECLDPTVVLASQQPDDIAASEDSAMTIQSMVEHVSIDRDAKVGWRAISGECDEAADSSHAADERQRPAKLSEPSCPSGTSLRV